MTFVRASRIASARTLSGPSTMRILHSSAQVGRGIAIGGSSQGQSIARSGPFASLRKEAEGGSSQQHQGTQEAKMPVHDSYQARKAAIRHDEQSDKVIEGSASTPSNSAQARLEAIKKDEQPTSSSNLSAKAASTSHEARLKAMKPQEQSSSPATGWKELGQRIESERKSKTNSQQSSPKENRSKAVERSDGAIQSIPRWSVSRYGLQRSFAFDGAVRSRMFLQGASSQLISETGWAGSLSLSKGMNGKESIEVRLAGSREASETDVGSSGVTEHDITLAETLDQLYSTFISASHGQRQRSSAFDNTEAQQSTETESYSVLRQDSADEHSPIDDYVPFHVSHQQSTSSEQSNSPTHDVLGATGSRENSKPIEEYVPVPNLHQQPKREFATMMGNSTSSTLASPRAGIASIIAARSSALNGLSTSSPLQRKRLVATWTGANVNASQRLWTGLVTAKAKPLKIDDFVPVHIDGAQMGKRRPL